MALATPGSLTLRQVTLRGGLAQGGRGGNAGTTFASDPAGGGGGAVRCGAVYNRGTLTIEQSAFIANNALGGAGGAGHNAFHRGGAGQGLGGGIFARNGSVTINNATLSNNTAVQGGSLYLLGDGATVFIDGARTVVGPGDTTSVTFNVSNSIFANTPNAASDAFVNTINAGTATPGAVNNNLVERNGSDPTMADANDLPGVTKTADPQLGALTAPNCGTGGCRMPVHPITATSPAYDMAGSQATTVDQCGTARPKGAADIGAYELVLPPVTLYTHALADPLGCLGPDGLVAGTITLGNPAAFDQPFTLDTTFTNLTGVAGSCTLTGAAPGATCDVTAGGLTAAGTLPAGATLTVQYTARVQNVAVGTTVSASNTAMLSGGNVPPVPLTASALVNCPAAGLKNPPADAAGPSAQQAGSVLVFPYYTSDAGGNFARSDTLLTITNVSNGAATGANGSPNYDYLHLFFVAANCSPADTFVCLTPNASLQIRASEYDPLTTGYLVAVAVDAQGLPTANNNFVGAAFVRDDVSGVIDSYGAEAFRKLSAGSLAAGAGGGATLYFDGADYEAAPIQLATPLQDPSRAGQTLVIASLRGDLGAKLDPAGQSGAGVVYRDEVPASFQPSLGGACFIRRAVTNQNFRVVPGPLTSFLKDRSGYAKFNLASPGVGLLLTKQGAAGAGQNRFSGIRALAKAAVSAASLRLPAFPPFCN